MFKNISNTDNLTTPQILMKWAIKNNEYYMVYILYTELNIGIPNTLLYKLPDKQHFGSVKDFLDTSDTKSTNNEYLNKIFVLFKKSKYKRLPEWRDKYGYKLS